MTTQINAYLHLDGQCREAMTFYKNCFGGELIFQSVEESPMASQWPEAMQKQILHASLISGDLVLMASDMTDGQGAIVSGTNISLSINCGSRKEMETFFSALSEGGKITRPIHEFFAGLMGALTDKYGIFWMFYAEKN